VPVAVAGLVVPGETRGRQPILQPLQHRAVGGLRARTGAQRLRTTFFPKSDEKSGRIFRGRDETLHFAAPNDSTIREISTGPVQRELVPRLANPSVASVANSLG
jgi:hypothetical protein